LVFALGNARRDAALLRFAGFGGRLAALVTRFAACLFLVFAMMFVSFAVSVSRDLARPRRALAPQPYFAAALALAMMSGGVA
jgi:hypothetical protein